VHGAISARLNLGMAASRDNTTTGRRPIPGGSHHHSSPRLGRSVTSLPPHRGRSRGGLAQLRPTMRIDMPMSPDHLLALCTSTAIVLTPGCRALAGTV